MPIVRAWRSIEETFRRVEHIHFRVMCSDALGEVYPFVFQLLHASVPTMDLTGEMVEAQGFLTHVAGSR